MISDGVALFSVSPRMRAKLFGSAPYVAMPSIVRVVGRNVVIRLAADDASTARNSRFLVAKTEPLGAVAGVGSSGPPASAKAMIENSSSTPSRKKTSTNCTFSVVVITRYAMAVTDAARRQGHCCGSAPASVHASELPAAGLSSTCSAQQRKVPTGS